MMKSIWSTVEVEANLNSNIYRNKHKIGTNATESKHLEGKLNRRGLLLLLFIAR